MTKYKVSFWIKVTNPLECALGIVNTYGTVSTPLIAPYPYSLPIINGRHNFLMTTLRNTYYELTPPYYNPLN